ncbi:MAG: hypothetical protein JWR80_6332 [Bradyrhizobium sp.]|nr:hypothetical protein [Bradyrhizobium sp.]
MTLDEAQALVSSGPYLNWLGLQLLELGDDSISVKAVWRPEWVANAKTGHTQGGILAALVDFAADFALLQKLGRPVPTIDMRVDYHRPAIGGNLIAKGRIIKFGGQISVCEAQVLDAEGVKLIASGRGTYYTATKAA